jgi:16S rRNA (guanine(966)-N(2))-methyltransferase RsmD
LKGAFDLNIQALPFLVDRHAQAGPTLKGHTGSGTVRIIGGQWKRTPLTVIDVPGLRPTSDRVRETLFNWLVHALGDLGGRSVLDLFAGSGALGFEAASRGAAPVVLVENNPQAVEQLHAIRVKLAADQIDVRSGDALMIGNQLRQDGRRFDLIFLDPPFGQGKLPSALAICAEISASGGFMYVEAEQSLNEQLVDSLGLEIYRSDKAGEVFYHLLQRKKTV